MYPGVPHALCLYHLSNTAKTYETGSVASKKGIRSEIVQWASCQSLREFETRGDAFKAKFPQAHAYLMSLNLEQWSLAHIVKARIANFGFRTNNVSETQNHQHYRVVTLSPQIFSPMLSLQHGTRSQMGPGMIRSFLDYQNKVGGKMKEAVQTADGILLPFAAKRYQDQTKKAGKFQYEHSNSSAYTATIRETATQQIILVPLTHMDNESSLLPPRSVDSSPDPLVSDSEVRSDAAGASSSASAVRACCVYQYQFRCGCEHTAAVQAAPPPNRATTDRVYFQGCFHRSYRREYVKGCCDKLSDTMIDLKAISSHDAVLMAPLPAKHKRDKKRIRSRGETGASTSSTITAAAAATLSKPRKPTVCGACHKEGHISSNRKCELFSQRPSKLPK